MKAALVTGSDGFVGRHFVKRLRADGWFVNPIDIKSGHDCRSYFRNHHESYDLVVHLAAMVGSRVTRDAVPISIASDFAIDSDYLQWVLQAKPSKAVYFSSSAAYPVAYQDAIHRGPLTEADINLANPIMPDGMYGWIKLTGELIGLSAIEQGANLYTFRPFSGYGTDQDLDYPFPSIVDRAVRRVEPFEVWGPGTQTRDFVHIDDVINTVMAALDYDSGPDLGTTNIATGRAVTMVELAQIAMAAAGHTADIHCLIDKPHGTMYRRGDPTKMNRFYTAQIPIEEGVDRAVSALSQFA